ncbi:hypothetical protein [Micromonospora sp. KC723]|uniref:hypothetical protein n=1 Tax=Micromonospora sp. KC723 TaxID=2530381 RepID=UPI001051B4CB|nr:hypothetical protein [Micromonospora sp. KC723]TDB76773.1 hypothetical protein E1165_05800 [Micromonospora sp. KC723]
MSGQDWTEVVGAIGLFALVITVIVVAVTQLTAVWRAKAALSREAEYRKIAEAAVRTQETNERLLADLVQRSEQTQARLGSIEQILKQVE